MVTELHFIERFLLGIGFVTSASSIVCLWLIPGSGSVYAIVACSVVYLMALSMGYTLKSFIDSHSPPDTNPTNSDNIGKGQIIAPHESTTNVGYTIGDLLHMLIIAEINVRDYIYIQTKSHTTNTNIGDIISAFLNKRIMAILSSIIFSHIFQTNNIPNIIQLIIGTIILFQPIPGSVIATIITATVTNIF